MDAYLPPSRAVPGRDVTSRPVAARPDVARPDQARAVPPAAAPSSSGPAPGVAAPGVAARPDPLVDIVLRCTTPGTQGYQSAAGEPGRAETTSPAVLAARLRRTALDATRRLLSSRGPAISVGEVAEQSGVLESALRAEFADTAALLRALMVDEIEALIADLAHRDLADGLRRAALAVSGSPLLENFTGEWSGVLAQLARVDVRLQGWAMAAQAVDAALARAGRRGTPTVLRWLASYFCAPSSAEDISADVEVLISGLPPLRSQASWKGRRTG